jgi:hypothetical protein
MPSTRTESRIQSRLVLLKLKADEKAGISSVLRLANRFSTWIDFGSA